MAAPHTGQIGCISRDSGIVSRGVGADGGKLMKTVVVQQVDWGDCSRWYL